MKKMTIIYVLLFSFFALADNRISLKESGNKEERMQKTEIVKNAFDVLPLNSPVKESMANFLIKINGSLEIEEVMYRIQNAGKIFEKPTDFQKVVLSNGPEGKLLKVNVSKLPPGFYQLFVKIRDMKGIEYTFKTKYKDHAMFVIDNLHEVPMPDSKKNNATVAGIDSDNDGIRDDIQRWINEEFGIQPKIKMAMRQIAMSIQVSLLNANDREKSIASSRKYLNDLRCLLLVAGKSEKDKLSDQLIEKYLNTKDRLYAEIKANGNFSGQVWDSPGLGDAAKAMCNFDFNIQQ